jgi:hypothetical protein
VTWRALVIALDLHLRKVVEQAVQVGDQNAANDRGTGSAPAGKARSQAGGEFLISLDGAQPRSGIAPHEQWHEGTDPGAGEAIGDLLNLGLHDVASTRSSYVLCSDPTTTLCRPG